MWHQLVILPRDKLYLATFLPRVKFDSLELELVDLGWIFLAAVKLGIETKALKTVSTDNK